MATTVTATIAPPTRQWTPDDLVAVSDALDAALDKVEELSMAMSGITPCARDFPLDQKWLLLGFARDTVVTAESIMRFALGFKADAEGGYLPREGDLMHALGGSFDD